jgi:hypothetical protein
VNDDDLRARLRCFGEEPIDAATRAAHMRRIAAAGSTDEPRRLGLVWAGIAAAAVVGFLAGSTGLAMADALPDPAQEVAHDVLRVVQVDVPQGKEGKRGPCVAEAAKIKDKDARKAAKDACPKGGPDESGDESGDDAGESGDEHGQPGGPPAADDPCHGRPPWAGPMSKEQRQVAKESASRENCPEDDEDKDATDRATEDATEDENVAATGSTSVAPTESTTPTASTEPAEPSVIDEPSSGG